MAEEKQATRVPLIKNTVGRRFEFHVPQKDEKGVVIKADHGGLDTKKIEIERGLQGETSAPSFTEIAPEDVDALMADKVSRHYFQSGELTFVDKVTGTAWNAPAVPALPAEPPQHPQLPAKQDKK